MSDIKDCYLNNIKCSTCFYLRMTVTRKGFQPYCINGRYKFKEQNQCNYNTEQLTSKNCGDYQQFDL